MTFNSEFPSFDEIRLKYWDDPEDTTISWNNETSVSSEKGIEPSGCGGYKWNFTFTDNYSNPKDHIIFTHDEATGTNSVTFLGNRNYCDIYKKYILRITVEYENTSSTNETSSYKIYIIPRNHHVTSY